MSDILRIARLKVALQRAFLGRAILICEEGLRCRVVVVNGRSKGGVGEVQCPVLGCQ